MDKTMIKFTQTLWFKLILAGSFLALLGFGAWGIQQASAMRSLAPAKQASPLHPTFALLDQSGVNVLETGQPLSTMKTCGQCHNTEFIETHAFHADLGLSDYNVPGQSSSHTTWDTSNGLFGKFDPLTYRYLSASGDQRQDLSTAGWLMEYGWRVAGGGPATTSRTGEPLAALAPDAANPETSLLDPQTGLPTAWDWSQSGVLEMNCFLCHTVQPNNAARIAEIELGNFGQANTATLLGTGIVDKSSESWVYNPQAFDETGHLKSEFVQIQDPSNANCAQCHGTVHDDPKELLLLDACDLNQPQTATTGQVIASQRINESGLNLADKAELSRSWDIHAERALECTDCHYAPNNPVHYQEAAENKPAHLTYDPRRLDIGEYLTKPDHNFARGESAQFNVAPEYKGTMRRCESCHEAEQTHASWLPYAARHMAEVACETCHIPQLYAPAIESYDWTVITTSGTAVSTCRGIQGSSTVTDLVTGYQPVLMQRTNVDGDTMLAPYNLVTSWYWVYEDPSGGLRPVRQLDLEAVYLQNGSYAPEILAAFDTNTDGLLDAGELKIDSDARQTLVAGRLAALGLQNPRIYGQVQPYSINHNVARGDVVVNDCQTCHSDESRITASLPLAENIPGGVMPEFVQGTNVAASGELTVEDGRLAYSPVNEKDGVYIFGHSRVSWIDWLGGLAFLGVLLAVGGHGTMRYLSTLRKRKHTPQTQEVYMYEPYERFWHWLQTFTIIFLLFTGLVIHRPDMFGIFSFPYMVTIHNVLAAILVLNAALSLFWHLVSGEVRQFIPHPYGFFDDAILQAKFYIQGIFKGDSHPFQKTRGKKLNPLQQVTYFGLLNVLLPLQIITGALMWGVQQWPQIAGLLGGLPFLAPFHSLVAWLFAAFIVAHVYLTTTGVTVFEDIKAMITGWEKVEVHEPEVSEAQATGG
jgi:thiosulfate reductase cytochrome b subunit